MASRSGQGGTALLGFCPPCLNLRLFCRDNAQGRAATVRPQAQPYHFTWDFLRAGVLEIMIAGSQVLLVTRSIAYTGAYIAWSSVSPNAARIGWTAALLLSGRDALASWLLAFVILIEGGRTALSRKSIVNYFMQLLCNSSGGQLSALRQAGGPQVERKCQILREMPNPHSTDEGLSPCMLRARSSKTPISPASSTPPRQSSLARPTRFNSSTEAHKPRACVVRPTPQVLQVTKGKQRRWWHNLLHAGWPPPRRTLLTQQQGRHMPRDLRHIKRLETHHKTWDTS